MKTRNMTAMVVLMGVLAFAMINCADVDAWMQSKAQPWDPANAVMITNQGTTVDVNGNVSPTLYDLDGNGTLDVIAGDGTGLVWFAMNQSADGFNSGDTYILTEPNWNLPSLGTDVSPAVGDLDGDGKWELVVGNAAGELLLVKISDYTWDAMAYTISPLPADGSENLPYSCGYTSPTLGDFDGDGDLDLMVGAGDGDLYYYENIGDAFNPHFAFRTTFSINFGSRASAAMIKLGDGNLSDFIVGNEAGEIYFCFSQISQCILKATVDPKVKVAAGDVNHDGTTDIVYGTGRGNAWYLQGVPAQ